MTDKEMAKWLMELAACYDHVPLKAAIARYLRSPAGMEAEPGAVGEARGRGGDPLHAEVPDARGPARDLRRAQEAGATAGGHGIHCPDAGGMGKQACRGHRLSTCGRHMPIVGIIATVRRWKHDRKAEGELPTGRAGPSFGCKAEVHLPLDPLRPGALHPRGKIP